MKALPQSYFSSVSLSLSCLQSCLCQSLTSCFFSTAGATRVWFPQLYQNPRCLITPRSPLSVFPSGSIFDSSGLSPMNLMYVCFPRVCYTSPELPRDSLTLRVSCRVLIFLIIPRNKAGGWMGCRWNHGVCHPVGPTLPRGYLLNHSG